MCLLALSPRTIALLAVLAGCLLAGCASLNRVRSTVSSYGTWPGDRVAGTYRFERLPSQEQDPQRQDRLEAAAAPALESAGFSPAAAGAHVDYTVQIGARVNLTEPDPWADPFWMSGRFHHPFAPWFAYGGPYWRPWGPGIAYQDFPDQYLREIALLIRDAGTGKVLFESRALSSGSTPGGDHVLGAMFLAALKEFPHADEHPHDISIDAAAAPATALPEPAASAPVAPAAATGAASGSPAPAASAP